MPLPFVACLHYRIFKKRYKNDLHSPKKGYKIREKKLKKRHTKPTERPVLTRSFYNNLLKWKDNKNKKAMLVTGARQIGKTSLIRRFGKEQYECFVELNFIELPKAKGIFRAGRDVESVIMGITALLGVSLIPGKTLIFFDEIQECPDARTAIKFLVEDGRFDYVESGSLLGVNSGETHSYPVGFEEIHRMYPMDLEEFALANGIPEDVLDHVRSSFEDRKPVSAGVHEALSRLFRLYVLTGGMPAVVQEFVSSHDIQKVVSQQRDILGLYRLDIAKYAGREKTKVQDIFDSIPSQLDDKNRRFMLASINKAARYVRYEDSFVWLRDAGVTLPCYNVSEPVIPLRLNEQRTLFKLFMADTGLLCAAGIDNIQFSILNGDLSINMGSLLENAFAQIFAANGFKLWYFNKQKYGELDFVLQLGPKCLPVEIKSGKDYRRHAALNNILGVSEWKFDEAIVFCMDNVSTDGKVTYLPWYMSMFLKTPQPESYIVDADFSGLSACIPKS